MDFRSDLLDPLLRWLHVVAGIVWIGHLYFFNFVNGQVAKTYDADSKKKVVPELMPRALYWFRWGAAYTWVSGILLVALLYYMGATTTDQLVIQGGPLSGEIGIVVSLVLILGAFVVYDALWRSPLGKNETAAATVSFLLAAAVAIGMSFAFSGTYVYLHMGAMFGTIMASNVWFRIWPAQRKIIAGIAGKAPAPDASVAAMAGLRSKHNTYMSVPLVLFMVSPWHLRGLITNPMVKDNRLAGVVAAAFIALGWAAVKYLYGKSASEAPKAYAAAGESKAA